MASRALTGLVSRNMSRSMFRAIGGGGVGGVGGGVGAGGARKFSLSARRLAATGSGGGDLLGGGRKPVGAFRGGLTGFLLGSTLAGAGVYYYILEEYKVSNELLTEDIYSLQNSVQRVHTYVQSLEEKLADLEKKKK